MSGDSLEQDLLGRLLQLVAKLSAFALQTFELSLKKIKKRSSLRHVGETREASQKYNEVAVIETIKETRIQRQRDT